MLAPGALQSNRVQGQSKITPHILPKLYSQAKIIPNLPVQLQLFRQRFLQVKHNLIVGFNYNSKRNCLFMCYDMLRKLCCISLFLRRLCFIYSHSSNNFCNIFSFYENNSNEKKYWLFLQNEIRKKNDQNFSKIQVT